MARKVSKQPRPKKGFAFTAWAVFNWGIPLNNVFRTRKEAQEYCWVGGKYLKKGKLVTASCWNNVKGHMAVVKVKCTVLND